MKTTILALAALFLAGFASASPLFTSVDPVFTPYKADGSVNFAAIPDLAAYSESQGVEIVLLGGSTGEWPSLSPDERLGLLKAWRAATKYVPESVASVCRARPHHRAPWCPGADGRVPLLRSLHDAAFAFDAHTHDVARPHC